MLLILGTTAITGGVFISGTKAYVEHKKKKERPWTFAAEKLRKRKNKANVLRINRPIVASSSSNPADSPSLLDKLLTPLLGKQREQLQQITGQKIELSAEEKRMHQNLAVASVNMGIAGMSLLYPPLIWLAIPGLLNNYIPFYQLSYKALKEGRASSYMLDSILLTGMVLGGYFYTAVIGSWFGTAGRILLLKSENNSKQNLMSLFSNQPRTVFVVTDNGVEVEMPFESLQVDDIIVIRAGQMIPVDGIITAGSASIDQHKLTGESQLFEAGVGEAVLASTVVLAGRIHIQTKKTGQQTVEAGRHARGHANR